VKVAEKAIAAVRASGEPLAIEECVIPVRLAPGIERHDFSQQSLYSVLIGEYGIEPSHVLEAMGLDRGEASSGLRFSLGVTTTGQDVDHALAQVPGVVDRLRN